MSFREHTARPKATLRSFTNAGTALLIVSTVTYYWAKGRIDAHRVELMRPENRQSRILTWEERAILDEQEAQREREAAALRQKARADKGPGPLSS